MKKDFQHSEKLKVAVLGGAINSAVGIAHFSALRLNHQFEIVAGCFSRNEEMNSLSGDEYGLPKDAVFTDLNQMLANNHLDAVHILTPTNQHADQVLQCLNAKVPVVCEKALGAKVGEVEKISTELNKQQGFLAVIYNYLGYPMLRELRSFILQKKLGNICQIQIEMPQEGFNKLNIKGQVVVPQDWRLEDGIIPTISLDLGVHLHMIVKYLTGEKPLETIGVSNTFGNFKSVVDNVSCMIRYTNNIACNMWFSKSAIGKRNGMKVRIFGDEGAASWNQENPEILEFSDKFGNHSIIDRANTQVTVCNLPRYNRFKPGHPAGFIEAFANYYDDVAISLRNFKTNQTDYLNEDCFGLTEALEGLQLLEAVARSGESLKWENVLS